MQCWRDYLTHFILWVAVRQVDRLAQSLDLDEGAAGAAGYTCESAEYFKLYHVVARIEQFKQAIAACSREPGDVLKHFPFTKFFATAPNQPVLGGKSFEDDLQAAEGACVLREIRSNQTIVFTGMCATTFTRVYYAFITGLLVYSLSIQVVSAILSTSLTSYKTTGRSSFFDRPVSGAIIC